MRPGLIVRRLIFALLACAAGPVAGQSACGAPSEIGDGWTAASPSEALFDLPGFCAAARVTATPEANFHGIVVERRGKLVAELYFRDTDRPLGAWLSRQVQFAPEVRHDLRSISKSVIGLLVGIAHDQGRLADLNAPMIGFFPEHADLATPERRTVTLRHLLTMTAGMEWDESGSYARLDNSETRMSFAWDRIRYVLERPIVARPGSRFVYNGGATALLAAIVERATGARIEDYAQKVLFGPLGITDVEWKTDTYGRVLPYSGLRMRPRDLLKLGRLMLDQGNWRGTQIVSSDWVRQSLRAQVPARDALGYGFQWWVGALAAGGRSLDWGAGFGNGGQRLYVLPDLELAVVITAGRYNQTLSGRASHDLFRQIVAAIPN